MRQLLYILIFSITILTSCTSHSPEEDCRRIITLAQSTNKLYTTEYSLYKDIIFSDNDIYTIFGHEFNLPGDRRIDIPFTITAKAYIDFSNFGNENVRIEDGVVTITLPDPCIEIISAKPDYSNVKEDTSWWRTKFSTTEREKFVRQGIAQLKDDIYLSMSPETMLNDARLNAFNCLAPLIRSLGYGDDRIIIRFPREYSGESLNTIIDKKKLD